MDRRPLQLQIALPVGIFDEAGDDPLREADELATLTGNMQREWHERGVTAGPAPITVLETRPLDAVAAEARAPRRRRVESVLGVSSDLRPALFDLKRQAPHFIITGPARSGRTTVLYNWALSLADRYPPDRIGFILVDLPRRFVEYGGKHRLSDLPHVVATAFEAADLDAALQRVKDLGPLLATSNPPRELFVLIDNFDDTASEIEGTPTAREFSALVRRFDREGLHCVVVGGAGSSGFELQRRIRNAGYGIGLRTVEAVGALNAARTPAAFRGGAELPVGRGYIVRAGQTTMIQIADPYASAAVAVEANGLNHAATPGTNEDEVDDDDPEDATAIALDAWVERLQAKYAACDSSWSDATPAQEPEPAAAPPSPRVIKMVDLAHRARHWEVQQRETKPELEPILAGKLDAFQPETWRDENALFDVLRTALLRNLAAAFGEEGAGAVVGSMGTEDVLNQLESLLPKGETNGVAF